MAAVRGLTEVGMPFCVINLFLSTYFPNTLVDLLTSYGRCHPDETKHGDSSPLYDFLCPLFIIFSSLILLAMLLPKKVMVLQSNY